MNNNIIVADISIDDYSKIRLEGIFDIHENSWLSKDRKDEGIIGLLAECDLSVKDANIQNVTINIAEECNSLDAYFDKFIYRVNELIKKDAGESCRYILILNLLPFCISRTRFDKIAHGIFYGKNKSALNNFSDLVILARNVDGIALSRCFLDLYYNNHLQINVIAVDIRCFGIDFSAQDRPRDFEVNLSTFFNILNFDNKRLYKSLVFETNIYLGHFALHNSHVRTHYNLLEFVKQDIFLFYLYRTFSELVRGADRILLIGVGMENAVIDYLFIEFKQILDNRKNINAIYFASDESNSDDSPDNFEEWPKNYDIGIIVTDIINSGKSVSSIVDKLNMNNVDNKPIKIFSIAKMKNSPECISGHNVISGVSINRKYYQNDPELCRLCQISQPIIEVEKIEDFQKVAEGQLTPFDFWEMVTDSDALIKTSKDQQGRHIEYQIDTMKIVNRYGHWLSNVIKYKYKEKWFNIKPEALLTINEPPSIKFAELVSQAISVKDIIKVDRVVLKKITQSGGLPENMINPFDEKGYKNIFIVDDGMNYGQSMTGLIKFCRSAGIVPIGSMVFDSRLGEDATNRIRLRMGNRDLIALYKWPAHTNSL